MRGHGRDISALKKSAQEGVRKARAEIKALRRLVRLGRMSRQTAELHIERCDAAIARAFANGEKDSRKVAKKRVGKGVKKGVKKERRGVAVEQSKSEDDAFSTPPRSLRLRKKTRVSCSPPTLDKKSPLTQAGSASQQASTITFEGRVGDPSTIAILGAQSSSYQILNIVWQFLPRLCSMMGAGVALAVLGRAFAAIENTPVLPPRFTPWVLALASLREATAYICVAPNDVQWRKEIDELARNQAITVQRAEASLVNAYFKSGMNGVEYNSV